jgi:tryptophan-rich sensory protein
MTIHQTQSDSVRFETESTSYRTRPEQLLGLGIYLSVCLASEIISQLSMSFLGTLYFISIGVGMWSLWRKYSLRVLKLEFSVFLSQILFHMCWAVSYFVLAEPFLALVILLLLWCNTMLATLLFWKKERISGVLYLFPLIWIFYLAGMNMVANP